MLYRLILIFALAGAPAHAEPGRFRAWLTRVCATYLIADHPYQVRLSRLPTPEVIREYRRQGGYRYWQSVDTDEFEMALSVMVNRARQGGLTEVEKEMLRDALADYPVWQIDYQTLMEQIKPTNSPDPL